MPTSREIVDLAVDGNRPEFQMSFVDKLNSEIAANLDAKRYEVAATYFNPELEDVVTVPDEADEDSGEEESVDEPLEGDEADEDV